MLRRSVLGLAAALAVAATSAFAEGTIKVGAIAPKTGPLAGGAVVTQWPNVRLWVEQVNARGGLNVGGEMMTIELIEYDDKTNPGEHIKLAQRLAEQDKVDFVVAPIWYRFQHRDSANLRPLRLSDDCRLSDHRQGG